MNNPIYLDNNSTTPLDFRVLQEMMPYLTTKFGNASSRQHQYGWISEDGVELAAERISGLLGCQQDEFIFTSGATESINLVLRGLYDAPSDHPRQLITCQTEHSAVLDTARELEKKGIHVQYLPVSKQGVLDLDHLDRALDRETLLVCLMMANNETGLIHPVRQIAKICHQKGALFFTDATQAFGKIAVQVHELDLDFLACSAHKIYGPKGVGGLFIRNGIRSGRLSPQITGGGQQAGLRSGTLNVAGIVGFGKASELALQEMAPDSARLGTWRNELERELLGLDEIYVQGDLLHRLPNMTNLQIGGLNAAQLLVKIPQLAISTGSACNSSQPEPSHVLLSMGLTQNEARSCIRIGLGRMNTQQEIEEAGRLLRKAIEEIRSSDPLYRHTLWSQ